MIPLKDNSVFLLQGDSITDAGRNFNDPQDLGPGYAMFFATLVQEAFPEKNIAFINRGIGGNRTIDLKNRWQHDCIDLKPDYVSILIGINDTWRRYDQNSPTSAETFEANYRAIIEDTLNNTNAQMIMLEPFLLYDPIDRMEWRADLDEKIFVCRKLAKEYGLEYIALDGMFAQKAMKTPYKYWLVDGVHPTKAGHMLIAKALLERFC